MKAIYQWLGRNIHGPYGTFIFGFLVFIEGFFIVPVSTLLAFYSLENRKRALTYATIATLVSVLGALAGYSLGVLLWKAGGKNLIYSFISPTKFDQLVDQFEHYQAWTTFVIALTPLPFKMLTITAGFCKLAILPFLGFTIVALGLRFYAISGAIYIWGEQVHAFLNAYFYQIAFAGIVLFVLLWFVFH